MLGYIFPQNVMKINFYDEFPVMLVFTDLFNNVLVILSGSPMKSPVQ